MANLPPLPIPAGALPLMPNAPNGPALGADLGPAPVGDPAIPRVLAAGGSQETKHATFAQLFNDTHKDPCHGNYARIMARFEASVPAAVASDMLFQQVTGIGAGQLQAYLRCSSGVGQAGPRIHCVHLPTKFHASLEGEPSAWDDRCFAFLGEVVQGHVTNVLFEETSFDIVTTYTRSQEYMSQNLEALTSQSPLFPPIGANHADAEEVTTRHVMYLPAAYVPLFLSAGGYTPRQVWERLQPALEQRQELQTCAPLLKWLQVASTGRALADPLAMGDPVIAHALYAPPADEVLLTHRAQVLHSMLPGLLATPTNLETALSQMAAALITQTNDTRISRERKLAAEMEPKLPSSKFTVTLPVLLDYLQLADERHLPDIWHKWANCSKRQEFQVLREALEAFARTPHAFGATVPIITAKLVQDLLNFNFIGDSADDIKMGVHPFIITDGNAEQRHANMEVARLYGYLNAGETTVSLADLEALQAKEVRSVPLTYWELEKNLAMFGNLLGVVLGLPHPLTAVYSDMWQLLRSGMRDDLHAAIEYRAYIKPTHVLRSIQLTCFNWFSHRRARLNPPAPDFKIILNQILLQVYILPRLPSSLYQLAYPKKHPPSDLSLPGLISTGSASGSSSDASTISTLSQALTQFTQRYGAATPPGAGPSGRGAFIANQAPIPAIVALDKPNIKIRDVIANAAPPKMDDNTDMCLSFLLRGGCWSNCKRASNHGQTLSPTETDRLQQFLTWRMATLTRTTGTGRTLGTTPPPTSG